MNITKARHIKQSMLFLAFVLFASQTIAQARVRPGVRLGINHSNISNTGLDGKLGPNVAVFADIRFTDFYALQPEIMYSRQGGKSIASNSRDLNIDYLSIGVANKFYVVPNRGLHFILGPSLDFDLENNIINLINETNDSEVTPFDFSIFMGIGYEFDFGLIVEARYKQGLLSIDLFDDIFYEYDDYGDTALNNVFQIGIAYKFQY